MYTCAEFALPDVVFKIKDQQRFDSIQDVLSFNWLYASSVSIYIQRINMNQSIRESTHREQICVALLQLKLSHRLTTVETISAGFCWVVVVCWLWKQIQPMGFSASAPASKFRQQLSLSICENRTLLRPSNLFLSSVGRRGHKSETSKSSSIYAIDVSPTVLSRRRPRLSSCSSQAAVTHSTLLRYDPTWVSGERSIDVRCSLAPHRRRNNTASVHCLWHQMKMACTTGRAPDP